MMVGGAGSRSGPKARILRRHFSVRQKYSLSNLSFRSQVLLLGGMVAVLIAAVLIASVAALRYTKYSVLSEQKKNLHETALTLAREYVDRAEFAHQNGGAPPLDSEVSASSSAALTKLTRNVIEKSEGVSGGFYQASSDELVGSAAAEPSSDGAGASVLDSQRPAILAAARTAARSRRSVDSVVAASDGVVLIDAVPIGDDPLPPGSAWTVKRFGTLPGANRFRAYLTAVGLGAAALICVFLTLLVTRKLQSGVLKVEKGLEDLEQNLSSRIVADDDPQEIQRIASAINRLGVTLREKIASEKQIEDQLRHAERLAALGRLIAGVAHEVRNPLATIHLRVQMCQQISGDQAVQDSCAVALAETERLNGMVSRLLSFSQPVQLLTEPVNVCQLIEERLERAVDRARSVRVRFLTNFPIDRRPVPLDANRMAQVFDNVIQNAIESMSQSGGTLCVNVASNGTKQAGRQEMCVEFNDTGSGMEPSVMRRVFDPFFTTKSTGTGLGLSICHELIRAHGGEIQVRSSMGHGTSVRILLPVTEPSPRTSAA
jgi:signal transduction histidine kinase